MNDEYPVTPAPTDIAIVGMAARLPGAANIDEFWRNLKAGRESIVTLTDDQLIANGEDAGLLADPAYVRAAAILDGYDNFDAEAFGLSPKEAAIMDPQHRLLLECASDVLENAGYDPDRFPGSIGVFAGCGMNAYLMFNLLANRRLMNSTGMFLVRHTGNDKDFLSTRISYTLNLRGPSVNVQTACSTSLVAIHLACQSLINGETDMALAGGVTIELPHGRGYICQEGEILSEDGHCRAFDAAATGTVFGSGGGLVALRRLSDALDSGDTIYAVIKGTAVNNDGAGKVGYLAPSVDGQAAAVAEAIGVAGVPADTIDYIETHGTGTRVGDPIEVQALTQAFRRFTSASSFCGLGSVKTNIGHLDTAAGVAGVIKTALALKHREIPPSLHFRSPNPLVDFASTPFYVNAELRPWTGRETPRRAGVNSLGVGGTNAHAILEEAPLLPSQSVPLSCELLTVSARTETALQSALANLAAYFRAEPEANLADVAFTLHTGRRAGQHRAALACRSVPDAESVLAAPDSKRIVRSKISPTPPSVAFLFPGGGAQYPGMGADLYDQHPLYRKTIDECLALIEEVAGTDVRPFLFPAPEARPAARLSMQQPTISLPTLFATEYALARLWMELGVEPAVVLGHSAGEHVAACIAGIMSLRDGIRAVCLRAQLLEQASAGAMLEVQLTEERLRPYLRADLSIAAINAPSSLVVSGAVAAIERLHGELTVNQVENTRLHISTAAHSPLLDGVVDQFRAFFSTLSLQPPQIRMISSSTGRELTPEEAVSSSYWAQQFRHTVRFADAVRTAVAVSRCFLEVGPGVILTSLLKLQPAPEIKQAAAMASLPHPQDTAPAWQPFLTSAGRLWTMGVRLNWDALYAGQARRRTPLPTYPFERRAYWIHPDPEGPRHSVEAPAAVAPAAQTTHFYQPVWKSSPLSAPQAVTGPVLVFADSDLLIAGPLREALEAKGLSVATVSPGEKFENAASARYTIRAAEQGDYERLFADLASRSLLPRTVVHLWPVTRGQATLSCLVDRTFHSLVLIARTLSELQTGAVEMRIVSNNLHAAGGAVADTPARAILLGPSRVIPAEYPNFTCQNIDVNYPPENAADCARRILEELGTGIAAHVVSCGADRKVLAYEPAAGASRELPWKTNGVYVITGGLGGIGLALAQSLAARFRPRLALVSRLVLPARAGWDSWLASHPEQDRVSAAIGSVRELEAAGATVSVLPADVADRARMAEALDEVRSAWGRIDGVLHAAGVLNDGVIQFKDAASLETVLRPKLHGTLVLSELLANEKLDFCVLFSSTSALQGLPGQVDYCAANAFLDAFAASAAGKQLNAVAVNWGVWKQTGMAAALGRVRPPVTAAAAGETLLHPLIGRLFARSSIHAMYSAEYDALQMWALNEHRMAAGHAIFPGSAYVEMIRAAIHNLEPGAHLTISDLQFVAPLHVGDNEPAAIHINVKQDAGEYSCVVTSRGSGAQAQEHAFANVRTEPAAAVKRVDVPAIRARCGGPDQATTTSEFLQNQVKRLKFGPRWDVLRSVQMGSDELIARLELPQPYQGDLNEYQTHPAVLDIATGAGLALLEGYRQDKGIFVPVSYGRTAVYGRLAPATYSHVVRTNGRGGAADLTTFDVTLFDENGVVLIELHDFTVRRLDGAALAPPPPVAPQTPANALLLDLLARGLTTEQGIEALDAVLSRCGAAQVVVTAIPLPELLASRERKSPSVRAGASAERTSERDAGRYDEVEAFLVDLWSDLLGVDDVKLQDDFFELGGHSLIAVRLFSRIKKKFNKEFGLATLFQARTIEKQAELIRGSGARPARRFSALVPIRETGSRAPLFLIAGMGGNLVGFDPLVRHIDADIPVYGLQSIGMDGSDEVLTRVEDMAARYLAEVRMVQPEGPYHLCGYSFGGLVGYEMAQQLRAASQEVGFVGLLDTYQQHYLKTLPRPSLLQVARKHARKARKHISTLIAGPRRWEYVRSRLQLFHVNVAKNYLYAFYLKTGRPLPKTIETVRYINPMAGANYVPAPLDGRLTLFRASIREPGEEFDRNLGWTGLGLRGLEVVDIPGSHLDVAEEPNVRTLAQQIERCLPASRVMAATASQNS